MGFFKAPALLIVTLRQIISQYESMNIIQVTLKEFISVLLKIHSHTGLMTVQMSQQWL